MNITISKRIKTNTQIPNKEHTQTQLLNTTSLLQQSAQCSKWLLQNCLKNQSKQQLQSTTLYKTKIHSVSYEKHNKNDNPSYKIKIISNKSRSLITQRIRQGGCLNQQEKIQNKMMLETIPKTSRIQHNNYLSIKRLKVKLNNSQKPTKNNSIQKDSSTKNKLKLSNNFNSILHTHTKPFIIDKITSPQLSPYTLLQNMKEQHIPFNISKFQIVFPSQNEIRVEDKQGESIDTSYLRQKLHFSSGFTNKNKFQDYIYEPVYTIDHSNNRSNFMKDISVAEEIELTPKVYSEESLVLEKGLEMFGVGIDVGVGVDKNE